MCDLTIECKFKRSSITYSFKNFADNILTDENEILSRWREYFEDILNPVKAPTRDTHEVTQLGEKEVFTAAEVATAIKGIKSAGDDEIRPEMLKALTGEGILWLTRVCQVAWKFGQTPRDWQTGVIIPIFNKGDRKQCTNYREISFLSLPGKVNAKCLERKSREIVESKLEDGQCSFRPGCSTTDQIFTLKQIFEKSWGYGKDLFACFVNLEKAYDRVPRDKLWKVLQEYGVNGQLLQAIKSFYCRPEVCVRVNGKHSKPFQVGVGLRQGCVLSPLLFIVYMNWIDKCSQADECATIGNCKICFLLQNLASSAQLISMPRFNSINVYQNRPKIKLFLPKNTKNFEPLSTLHCKFLATRLILYSRLHLDTKTWVMKVPSIHFFHKSLGQAIRLIFLEKKRENMEIRKSMPN